MSPDNDRLLKIVAKLSSAIDEERLTDVEKSIVTETLQNYIRSVFTNKMTAFAMQKSLDNMG